MEQESRAELRARLLERLRDEFRDDHIAAEYTPEEENKVQGGILAAMFDSMGESLNDVFGELFFMPDPDETAEVQTFVCAILISDDLDNADMPALYKACAKLTHTAPAGVFYVDEEGGRLIYKLGVPLKAELPDTELYDEMNIVVGNAMGIVDRSVDELLTIVDQQ